LGIKNTVKKLKGKYVSKKIDVCGYFVPFLQQLSALLSMPEVYSFIHEPVINPSELMTDVTDGSVYHAQQLDVDSFHLRFSLYSDEFEVVNPIGSHRKVHKITVFYWTLLNIPVEYRHKMHVIQLLAVARSRYLKEYGFECLLSDFCESLVTLQQGAELDLLGYGKFMCRGSLSFVLADTLAAHFLGGFKESVGPAYKPCRTCEISKTEIKATFFSAQCRLRNEQEHRDRMHFLKTTNKKAAFYWSRQWGVKKESILSSVPDFSLTSALLHDPMHVLLEGVARYELRAMLKVFVTHRK